MAILGGSPLGIIGVQSRPNLRTGFSTFPFDGNSIGVSRYNQAADEWRAFSVEEGENRTVKPSQKANKSVISIFSRRERPTRFTPFPRMDPKDWGDNQPSPADGLEVDSLHTDSTYDTSILNILQKLQKTKAELKASHFAYLKNVGVYPNNRLMIARRFGGAADGVANLMRDGHPPLATMITWVKQEEDFFSIDFGEEWVDAEADFTALLNDLGNDFLKGSGLGTKIGAGLGAIPLPGFTEYLQRAMLEKLGVLGEGSASFIPAGEPNLIKQAKRRKTVNYSEAGSGLKCAFSIKFVCEWEQKFISGLDPTIVYLDIINEIIRFGTSPSTFYGLSGGFMSKIMAFVNNPMAAIVAAINGLKNAIEKFKTVIKQAVAKAKAALGPKDEKPKSQEEMDSEEKANIESQKKELDDKVRELFAGLAGTVTKLLKNIVGKYRVRLQGIMAALSGAASGPWHVSIGNPMRPIFTSGDLICSDVKLTLGPTLAFNDLPSTIKAEFSLSPARPLGLQEIMGRFNKGHLRSILPYPSFEEKQGLARELGVGLEGTGATLPEPQAGQFDNQVDAAINSAYQYPGPQQPAAGPWPYRFEGGTRGTINGNPGFANVNNSIQAAGTSAGTSAGSSPGQNGTSVNANSDQRNQHTDPGTNGQTTNRNPNGPTFEEQFRSMTPEEQENFLRRITQQQAQ